MKSLPSRFQESLTLCSDMWLHWLGFGEGMARRGCEIRDSVEVVRTLTLAALTDFLLLVWN